MNKRAAKRLACWMIATVAKGAREGGWPYNEYSGAHAAGAILTDDAGNPTADAGRLEDALDDVIAEMTNRGYTAPEES